MSRSEDKYFLSCLADRLALFKGHIRGCFLLETGWSLPEDKFVLSKRQDFVVWRLVGLIYETNLNNLGNRFLLSRRQVCVVLETSFCCVWDRFVLSGRQVCVVLETVLCCLEDSA